MEGNMYFNSVLKVFNTVGYTKLKLIYLLTEHIFTFNIFRNVINVVSAIFFISLYELVKVSLGPVCETLQSKQQQTVVNIQKHPFIKSANK